MPRKAKYPKRKRKATAAPKRKKRVVVKRAKLRKANILSTLSLLRSLSHSVPKRKRTLRNNVNLKGSSKIKRQGCFVPKNSMTGPEFELLTPEFGSCYVNPTWIKTHGSDAGIKELQNYLGSSAKDVSPKNSGAFYDNIKIIGKLGKGKYGIVVKIEMDKKLYAMKLQVIPTKAKLMDNVRECRVWAYVDNLCKSKYCPTLYIAGECHVPKTSLLFEGAKKAGITFPPRFVGRQMTHMFVTIAELADITLLRYLDKRVGDKRSTTLCSKHKSHIMKLTREAIDFLHNTANVVHLDLHHGNFMIRWKNGKKDDLPSACVLLNDFGRSEYKPHFLWMNKKERPKDFEDLCKDEMRSTMQDFQKGYDKMCRDTMYGETK